MKRAFIWLLSTINYRIENQIDQIAWEGAGEENQTKNEGSAQVAESIAMSFIQSFHRFRLPVSSFESHGTLRKKWISTSHDAQTSHANPAVSPLLQTDTGGRQVIIEIVSFSQVRFLFFLLNDLRSCTENGRICRCGLLNYLTPSKSTDSIFS